METIPTPPDSRALSGALALAQGFAQQMRQWSLAQGASEAAAAQAARAAQALSLATSEGHVCLRLSDLEGAATLREGLLRDSRVVGTPQDPGSMPLVLDDEGRLYLHRYFDYERRLARRLLQARGHVTPVAEGTRARLNELFAPNAARLGGAADWQKIAAALALRSPLTVISGGPGTGKTTAVVNLLACLLEQSPTCRIALAAPTGKAAARMTEAIRGRAQHLPPALRERLPQEASTLHRLLGVRGDGSFMHHAGNLLAIDALVVDEASMLDLALAVKLLEAVPPGARIVLLGDKDQLAAVESGAVFSELSADPGLSAGCIAELAALCGTDAARIQPPEPLLRTGLTDHVVWFRQNFRFASDSGIGRLALQVNGGQAARAMESLRTGDPSVQWLDDAQPQPSAATQRRLLEGYAAYVATVRAQPSDAAAVTGAFGRYRVLAALREGARGVTALNDLVSAHMRRALGALDADPHSAWFPGRPVMILRNDPLLRLFNGDIGIALPDAGGALMVMFPQGPGFRAVAPVRLPAHQTAFAMTVHKSQGSEFDEVLLMLPDQPGRVLGRELLYTGLTRARERATLVGGATVIEAAIRTPTLRHSGLVARLREG